MSVEMPPSVTEAPMPPPVVKEEGEVVEEEKKEKKPKRKRRKYRVSMKTSTIDSSMAVERSGPQPAARDMARSHINQIPLREATRIWVRSSSKLHPFSVTRAYDNKKHRRFNVVRDGESISLKQASDPQYDVPPSLHT